MTPNEFKAISEMLKSESGLVLADDKQYLLESRLSPIAKKLKLASVNELVSLWRTKKDANLQNQIIEAMTINESFFFRDKTPFDNFENHMLPALIERNKGTKKIRIWSAAASTGQEAYSLSMILREHANELMGWKIDIVGTDLSSDALEKAKSGLYSQFEVQRGMPVKYLVKNFNQIGSMWQIKSDIRSMVQYRQFNLLKNYAVLGRFDIIFLRNVLIYFDKDTKADILTRMEKQSNDKAFLVLGASETLVGLNQTYKPVEGIRGLYHIDHNNVSSQKPSSLAAGTPQQSPARPGLMSAKS